MSHRDHPYEEVERCSSPPTQPTREPRRPSAVSVTRDAALALWANLRDRMQTGDASLTQVIEELSSHICAAMALDGVGLLVASSGRRRAVLGASDDRMRGLDITQANLTNQQGVVKNEVKVNVLNQPYGGFPWLDLPSGPSPCGL